MSLFKYRSLHTEVVVMDSSCVFGRMMDSQVSKATQNSEVVVI